MIVLYDVFFFDKDDDMGGDNEKEKEKDDSEEISQHVRLYMILVVFVTIMLWQKNIWDIAG